ncbi:MAG TPA: TauD/TfdA family dioxygenase [Paucimonas sp.]|nr:TauD/TfdA family dioxygenase [Paucimonas sp.]
MNLLSTESLRDDEQSVLSKISGKSFVVRAKSIGLERASLGDIRAHFRAHADRIKRQVREQGVLLFRGLPVSQPEEYEQILESLDYDLYRSNYGGASPRSNVTGKTFVSTEAPSPFIIGVHTEFCYQTTRPGMISFFCVTPAAGFGETPLFDLHGLWNDLGEPLRNKLQTDGLLYKRVFFGKKSLINFHKTWQDTFETRDKEVVRKFLEAEGMRYAWDASDNLSTELKLPAVLNDPLSGLPCISITTFNADSFIHNFRHFKERYHPVLRKMLEWFVTFEYNRKNSFLKVLHGCGRRFTREESVEIQRAAWANAIIFPWQTGDLLLIDNIRFGHARLNVRKPRRLIAAMADPYDVRSIMRAAPAH